MSDKISLIVGNSRIEHFRSYDIDADLYVADHAFNLELANPEIAIEMGMSCKLLVNDELELTGIVERRRRYCDKKGKTLTVAGRDLMGLLVDSYCEEFIDVQGKTIRQLAEFLIYGNKKTGRPPIPFIGRKQITGDALGLTGKLKTRKRRGSADFLSFFDSPQKLARIAPGQTVFQVLQQYALSRGVMFFSLPDGTFVFDEPASGGDPDYVINFTNVLNGSNAISADVDENISKRWSKVTVIGQQQSNNGLEGTTERIPTKGLASDPSFPFYKPYVACNNNDSQSPTLNAKMLLNKMRHDGFKLEYEMPRHSQNGKNFTINRLATVNDSVHGIFGTFLVTGRRYQMDKQKGPTTVLRLGLPGMVEAAGPVKVHK